jgi:hypothetical protein
MTLIGELKRPDNLDPVELAAYTTVAGLILNRLHLAVPEANLGGLRFTHVAFDYAAPSGNMYILNRRNLFIRWLIWMKASPAVEPTNQFAEVVKIRTIYNMVSDNPRRLGVISAIT